MNWKLFAILTALAMSGCARTVIKAEEELSASVTPALERLHEIEVQARDAYRADLAMQAALLAAPDFSDDKEQDTYVGLICSADGYVALSAAGPALDSLRGTQKRLDELAQSPSYSLKAVVAALSPKAEGKARAPWTPAQVAARCREDVQQALAAGLRTGYDGAAAAAERAAPPVIKRSLTALLPNIVGMPDEVARARTIRKYVEEKKTEIFAALTELSALRDGRSRIGLLVQDLKIHELRLALAHFLELQKTVVSSQPVRASAAHQFALHVAQYHRYAAMRIDGEGGLLPALRETYVRYIQAIENGNMDTVESLDAFLETTQRLKDVIP